MPPCLATMAPAAAAMIAASVEIIGAGSVAARADDVDGARRRLDPRHGGAHRLRRADDLLDRLAAHPQAHDEGAELRRRRRAFENKREGRPRLVVRQRRAGDESRDVRLEVAHGRSAISSRQFDRVSPTADRPKTCRPFSHAAFSRRRGPSFHSRARSRKFCRIL